MTRDSGRALIKPEKLEILVKSLCVGINRKVVVFFLLIFFFFYDFIWQVV